jgi:hypothetical protein
VIRYNFGTTGGEISGERTCKRRSAKHLEFLPSLLEGRRSIQLSYGRAASTHSNSFIGRYNTILAAPSLCRRGRRSTKLSYGPILPIHLILRTLQKPIRIPILPESWSNLEQPVISHVRAPQHCPRRQLFLHGMHQQFANAIASKAAGVYSGRVSLPFQLRETGESGPSSLPFPAKAVAAYGLSRDQATARRFVRKEEPTDSLRVSDGMSLRRVGESRALSNPTWDCFPGLLEPRMSLRRDGRRRN